MGNYYSGMMNATGGSELRHHGIIGQKWGVRRFQNKDGTWTDVGKKRRRSAYETSDAGYSDQQKKGFFEKRRDKRVENYFNRMHDTEKLEKYQQLDKNGKKQVFNAVRDLEGPHGFKGKREMRNLNRIGPVNQHIGRKMRDNRLNRGAKAMEEAFADEEVRYTGQPKKGNRKINEKINAAANTMLNEFKKTYGLFAKDLYDREMTKKYAKDLVKNKENVSEDEIEKLTDKIGVEFQKKKYEKATGVKYDELMKDTDFSNLPKKEKEKRELDILRVNDLGAEEFNSDPNRDAYLHLGDRIVNESGNYYDSQPVTRAFEKMMNKLDDAENNRDKYRKVREQEFTSVVLKDIGYEDTPEARRLIETMIFWD